MKILFASDLHGSVYYGKKLEEVYKREKATQLILLGDLLYHGARNPLPKDYSPKELVSVLNGFEDVIAIRGNCDSEVDQMVLDFEILSQTLVVVDGLKLFLTHGHKYNESNLPKIKSSDVLIHGHTHIPLAKKTESCFVFNPGSLTMPKGGYESSYGVYENKEFTVKALDGAEIMKIKID